VSVKETYTLQTSCSTLILRLPTVGRVVSTVVRSVTHDGTRRLSTRYLAVDGMVVVDICYSMSG